MFAGNTASFRACESYARGVVAAGQLLLRDGQRTTSVATAAALAASAVVAVHLVGVSSFSHEPLRGASPELDLPIWAAALSWACLILAVVGAWVNRTARPGLALGLAIAA